MVSELCGYGYCSPVLHATCYLEGHLPCNTLLQWQGARSTVGRSCLTSRFFEGLEKSFCLTLTLPLQAIGLVNVVLVGEANSKQNKSQALNPMNPRPSSFSIARARTLVQCHSRSIKGAVVPGNDAKTSGVLLNTWGQFWDS